MNLVRRIKLLGIPLHNLRRRGLAGYRGGDCYECAQALKVLLGGDVITAKWKHDLSYHWLLRKKNKFYDLSSWEVEFGDAWADKHLVFEGGVEDYWKPRPSELDHTWVLKWWINEHTYIHIHHDVFEINNIPGTSDWGYKFGLLERAAGVCLSRA